MPSYIDVISGRHITEDPRQGAVIIGAMCLVGVILNICSLFVMAMSKADLFCKLLGGHQIMTLYINLVHGVWIPVVIISGWYSYRVELAISSIMFYCYYCIEILIFLLTLNRFAAVWWSRRKNPIENNPKCVCGVVVVFGAVCAGIFPFSCSRPYFDDNLMSFLEYHDPDSFPCNAHAWSSYIINTFVPIVLPVILDVMTLVVLYRQIAARKKVGMYYSSHAQVMAGLVMCCGLHVLHIINYSCFMITAYVEITDKQYFYLTTVSWIAQNMFESCLIGSFFYVQRRANQKFARKTHEAITI